MTRPDPQIGLDPNQAAEWLEDQAAAVERADESLRREVERLVSIVEDAPTVEASSSEIRKLALSVVRLRREVRDVDRRVGAMRAENVLLFDKLRTATQALETPWVQSEEIHPDPFDGVSPSSPLGEACLPLEDEEVDPLS